MEHAKPLPETLAQRYRAWRAERFAHQRDSYAELARIGQTPQAMIITCCDSRVMVAEMFGAEAGDYFVHRNIAALVPPHGAPSGTHGTLSTIEYAVENLGVGHIVVVGHSGCGGVAACDDICTGAAPELARGDSYVGSWLQNLAPCHPEVAAIGDRVERLHALERAGVVLSLRNLMTLPFVSEAVRAGRLEIHGVWKNIGGEELEVYDPARGFVPLDL
jgi:carbonic anhydrase